MAPDDVPWNDDRAYIEGVNAVASIETFVLRQIRLRGPGLLGATRRVVRDSRGRATNYLELGTDRDGTLVFLHGFSDRPEHFLGTAALLRDRYRILIPAMAGFGDGIVDVHANHSLATFGELAVDLLDRIAGPSFHLMGNSLGGACALVAAKELGPRVETLTLVDTAGVKPKGISCVFDDFEEGKNPFEIRSEDDHHAFMRTIAHRPNPALGLVGNALFLESRANADWYARLGRELAVSVREFVERGDDCFVDLGAIETPTLVLWGEHDALFPHAIGSHIATRMPNARFTMLPGVGHCPHLERPHQLAKAFLEQRPR